MWGRLRLGCWAGHLKTFDSSSTDGGGGKKMLFKYQKLARRKFNQQDSLSSNSMTLMEN